MTCPRETELFTKVVDAPQRLRDTLIHELCHAATWIIDHGQAGHGPLWKKCIKRHSKSIDATKKCCGYCPGTFELIVNKKNKDGVVVSTPARKAGPNDFALHVKGHYATMKDGVKTHAQVMKILGEHFSAKKIKPFVDS